MCTVTSLRKSIEKFGEECSNIVTATKDSSDEEVHRLENELKAALERLRKEVDRRTSEVLEFVMAKKPPKETPQDDPANTSYKALVKETKASVEKTTNWFLSIWDKIKRLIPSIIEKVKTKFADIGRYIKDEFKQLSHHPMEHEELLE